MYSTTHSMATWRQPEEPVVYGGRWLCGLKKALPLPTRTIYDIYYYLRTFNLMCTIITVQRRDFHFVVNMCLPYIMLFFCFRNLLLSCIIIKDVPIIVNHLILFLISRVSGENKGVYELRNIIKELILWVC